MDYKLKLFFNSIARIAKLLGNSFPDKNCLFIVNYTIRQNKRGWMVEENVEKELKYSMIMETIQRFMLININYWPLSYLSIILENHMN